MTHCKTNLNNIILLSQIIENGLFYFNYETTSNSVPFWLSFYVFIFLNTKKKSQGDWNFSLLFLIIFILNIDLCKSFLRKWYFIFPYFFYILISFTKEKLKANKLIFLLSQEKYMCNFFLHTLRYNWNMFDLSLAIIFSLYLPVRALSILKNTEISRKSLHLIGLWNIL